MRSAVAARAGWRIPESAEVHLRREFFKGQRHDLHLENPADRQRLDLHADGRSKAVEHHSQLRKLRDRQRRDGCAKRYHAGGPGGGHPTQPDHQVRDLHQKRTMRLMRGTPGRALSIGLVAAALIASATHPAFGQNTAQLPLQFDFLPPGARSVGMGSAFIAAADDATAAFTNPAGPARLTRREISGELRFKRLDTPFLFGGRITGSITGAGLDTSSGPIYREDVDDQFGPAVIAFLRPIGP